MIPQDYNMYWNHMNTAAPRELTGEIKTSLIYKQALLDFATQKDPKVFSPL